MRWPAGFVLALVCGVVGGVASSSCVALDECILVVTHGDDWCRQVVGARRWPPGDEELAVLVVVEDDDWPKGCVCFNDAEAKILEGHVPADVYAELSLEIEQAARNACAAAVPMGWDHDCYDESPEGPVLTLAVWGDVGDCVGDCVYVNEPKGGCGDDPDPYQCEDLAGGDTGGEDESGDETDTGGRPTIDGVIQWRR